MRIHQLRRKVVIVRIWPFVCDGTQAVGELLKRSIHGRAKTHFSRFMLSRFMGRGNGFGPRCFLLWVLSADTVVSGSYVDPLLSFVRVTLSLMVGFPFCTGYLKFSGSRRFCTGYLKFNGSRWFLFGFVRVTLSLMVRDGFEMEYGSNSPVRQNTTCINACRNASL